MSCSVICCIETRGIWSNLGCLTSIHRLVITNRWNRCTYQSHFSDSVCWWCVKRFQIVACVPRVGNLERPFHDMTVQTKWLLNWRTWMSKLLGRLLLLEILMARGLASANSGSNRNWLMKCCPIRRKRKDADRIRSRKSMMLEVCTSKPVWIYVTAWTKTALDVGRNARLARETSALSIAEMVASTGLLKCLLRARNVTTKNPTISESFQLRRIRRYSTSVDC